jgi:hypothetical protein
LPARDEPRQTSYRRFQNWFVRERARVEKYRREHLLPDTESLEKIQRYESHLSRQFHRDLHELQRLQAMRQGHPVTTPVAVDVEVYTESKAVTETAG